MCKAILYLAEEQLKGIYPRNCHAPDALLFDLKQDNLQDEWAAIIGSSSAPQRTVSVAVGFEDGTMLASGGAVEVALVRGIGKIPGPVALGETITVPITDLASWKDPAHPLSKAVLYLADQQLTGIYPRKWHEPDALQFELKRDDLKPQWAHIIGSPNGFTRKLPVAVGFEDGTMLASGGTVGVTLIRTDVIFWIFLLLFLLATGLFLFLARRSDMLRDQQDDPESGGRKPYSLARCQMAWWFFIILAAYLLIWLMTDDRDTLSSSALSLFGISSATALGAAAIDASKKTDAESQAQPLRLEQTALKKRIGELEAKPSKTDEEKRELSDKQARLAEIEASPLIKTLKPLRSEGFLNDILTDVNGVSLHRFQITVWTVTLGIIFAVLVYRTLGMPDFSGTLLALMGISNGTYIGFKFPEKQA